MEEEEKSCRRGRREKEKDQRKRSIEEEQIVEG